MSRRATLRKRLDRRFPTEPELVAFAQDYLPEWLHAAAPSSDRLARLNFLLAGWRLDIVEKAFNQFVADNADSAPQTAENETEPVSLTWPNFPGLDWLRAAWKCLTKWAIFPVPILFLVVLVFLVFGNWQKLFKSNRKAVVYETANLSVNCSYLIIEQSSAIGKWLFIKDILSFQNGVNYVDNVHVADILEKRIVLPMIFWVLCGKQIVWLVTVHSPQIFWRRSFPFMD